MITDSNLNKGSVRIGIDFGISTTVVAVTGPGRDCHTFNVPGISREYPSVPGVPPIFGIPSFIEYENGKVARSGEAVVSGGSANHPATARWLRRHLCDNSPVQIPAGDGRLVRYDEAASDFLTPIISHTLREYPGAGLVFSVPSNAPDKYPELLQRIARSAGAASSFTVNEYQAAAAGYGYTPSAGEPFITVFFSETELEVTCLNYDKHPTDLGGDRLRVLAQTTGSFSCQTLDTLIVQDLLFKFRLLESDSRAVRLLPLIKYKAAGLREYIPIKGKKEIRLLDPGSGKTFITHYTAADLDRVLAESECIPLLEDCIGRALSGMKMRGVDCTRIGAVLLLGGGCALPVVQDSIRSLFPETTVYSDHPVDAVARGAAGHTIPSHAKDRITCSYALRYWDPAAQEHYYRFLVHNGARYPSAGQVARIVISAAYDGQTHLGIPVYEIGGSGGGNVPGIELVTDTGGGVRFAGPVQDANKGGLVVYANERSPTLLVATPPARKGESRFECTFTIDHERNLCLSARDLVTGTLVKLNAPVHRLT
jgi:molecular chaperone DnaK